MPRLSQSLKTTSKKVFLAISDIEFWLAVGAVVPNRDTLIQVFRNATAIQKKFGTVKIAWLDDGSFEISNS